MEKALIGSCGIYCRACDHYFANTEEGKHLLENSAIAKRVTEHPCQGCKSEKEKICVFCVGCDVRLCSIEKGVLLCTECEEYPCNKLERFKTGLEHHKEAGKALEEMKGRKASEWAEVVEQRWTCPSCGKKYSYYEQVCVNCNASLNGFGPDVR